MDNKFKSLDNLIGRTPLVEIILRYKDDILKIYSKLEYYNYTGSIKDRIAFYIIKKSYENNELKKGQTIVEGTSGNTGISFSAIGKFTGHKVKIFMPEWMSEERKKIILSFGAELRLVTKEEGGFLGCVKLVEEEVKKYNYFSPYQFSNKYNSEAHYYGTAMEIEKQFHSLNLSVDAFVAGVGTGGTLMGVTNYFKVKNENFKSFPLEPENCAVISGNRNLQEHKIQGIGDGFIPKIMNLDLLESAIQVNENDSIIMSQMLSKTFGLGVGISSGANLLGAIKVKNTIGKDKNVVTVFTDDNKKYLSTDYTKNIEKKSNFLTNNIELLDINIYKY